jgi:hypothetical protein
MAVRKLNEQKGFCFLSLVLCHLGGVCLPILDASTYVVSPIDPAYKTFASLMEAHRLSPDDIVEFQASAPGGKEVFAETITPNGDGAAGHPIVIRARLGDEITIDGGQVRANTVYIQRRHDIIFEGLIFRNAAGGTLSGSITLNASDDITIKRCSVYISLVGDGVAARRGIATAHQCNRLAILDSSIATEEGSWGPGETDCIFAAGANIRIVGNLVVMHNAYAKRPSGHNDGIQTLDCADLLIDRNVCDREVASAFTQGQGIYCEWYNHDDGAPSDYGRAVIRNNVVFGNGGSFLLQTMVRPAIHQLKDAVVAISIENNLSDAYDFKASMPFRMAHGGYFITGSAEIVNNIFIMRRTIPPYVCMVVDVPYASEKFKSDYNHFYPAAAKAEDPVIGREKQLIRLGQWKSLGWDGHSIGFNRHWQDPLFIRQPDRNYHLGPQSPDIGTGANLGDKFTSDNDNLPRSTDGTWDIGPFRFGEGGARISEHGK